MRARTHTAQLALTLALSFTSAEAAGHDASAGRSIPAALRGACAWVLSVPIDVDTLDARGLVSKKCLAEGLECCWVLERGAHASGTLVARARGLAAQTERPRYHDEARCDSAQFHRDSMSYLRVAWLMERLGLDTRVYRDSIRAIAPRLARTWPGRGPWQRAMFAAYAKYFGLPAGAEPGPLDSGLVARRHPLERFDADRAYDLAHEVFAVYEDPAGEPARTFSTLDVAYLEATLPTLTATEMSRDNVDLTAELASAMAYLGMHGDGWTRAIHWLMSKQNADGSWGSYPGVRPRHGVLGEKMGQLHTTMVVAEALLEAEGVRNSAKTAADATRSR